MMTFTSIVLRIAFLLLSLWDVILNILYGKHLAPIEKATIEQASIRNLGMTIPRKISFLEKSRNQGMAILHSSGIEEDKIYSSGSSGNFEERDIPFMIQIYDFM